MRVWSAGREKLLRFCPRAYFYNYHLASAGYDHNADTKQKLLYRLKHLLPIQLWQRSLFRRTLREMFYKTPAEFSGKTFQQRLQRNLLGEYNSLVREDWRQHAKCVNLYETYYGKMSHAEAFTLVENVLNLNANHLVASELFQQLCNTSPLDRVEILDFFHFNLNTLVVWCTLDLGWRRRDSVNLVAITNEDSGEYSLVNAALHKIFAQYNLAISPDKTVSHGWAMANGETFIVPDRKINISKTIDHLRESAIPLCQDSAPDIKQEHEFRGNPENCDKCRFLEYCETSAPR